MSEITSASGPPIPAYGAIAPTNGLAIASMVCGLVSLVTLLTCLMVIVTGIPAVICGHMANFQLKRSSFQRGKGFALTGLITGYLSIVMTLGGFVGFWVLIARDIG